MISNFTIKGNKIILKNTGEYFGVIAILNIILEINCTNLL